MIELSSMTDEELSDLAFAVNEERSARHRRASREQAMNEMLETAKGDDGVESGAAWVAPSGAHDSYPLGWIVAHAGKEWESLVTGNVWEPGVSGWREVAPGVAAWVQPTGAHDAYSLGAVVSHNGQTWVSTAAANVWEPGVYGWSVQ